MPVQAQSGVPNLQQTGAFVSLASTVSGPVSAGPLSTGPESTVSAVSATDPVSVGGVVVVVVELQAASAATRNKFRAVRSDITGNFITILHIGPHGTGGEKCAKWRRLSRVKQGVRCLLFPLERAKSKHLTPVFDLRPSPTRARLLTRTRVHPSARQALDPKKGRDKCRIFHRYWLKWRKTALRTCLSQKEGRKRFASTALSSSVSMRPVIAHKSTPF